MKEHFSVHFGEDMTAADISQLFALDEMVYEDQYVGEIDNMLQRFYSNPRSFVAVRQDGRYVGYINFLNLSKALYQDIMYASQEIRDDDIRPEELAPFTRGEEQHLFILSMVIHPDFRDQKVVIQTLTDGLIEALLKLGRDGYQLGSISATAVSEDGCKMLRNLWFRRVRQLQDENIVYVCDGDRLKRLLQKKLYFKTFQDDIYLLLPYADHPQNTRIERLKQSYDPAAVTGLPKTFLEELQANLEYECKTGVTDGIELLYLGSHRFLHTTDEYDIPEEIIMGSEEVYLFLAAHQKSHMHVLILFLPNCRYSTSQVADQMSVSYLKICTGKKEGYESYEFLNTYLKYQFGLHACGSGKMLVCMSKKPDTAQEFANILAAESCNSVHVDYHIQNPELQEMCARNLAKYDYYEAYMSEQVIAMILKDFLPEAKDRMEIMATYLFIAVLVMFQNTSLDKMHMKITRALQDDGKVSYAYIDELYRNYGLTAQFWEKQNFKYPGTQMEAEQIQECFANRQLKETCMEEQKHLEHIVDLNMAQNERMNGWIINIAAIVLALLQIQPYLIELLQLCYSRLGIELEYADRTFNTSVFGGLALILVVYIILHRKNRKS